MHPAQEVILKQRLLEHRGHLLQAQHVAKVGEFLLSQGPSARGVKTVKQLLELLGCLSLTFLQSKIYDLRAQICHGNRSNLLP